MTTVLAALASAVIIATGIGAFIRALWRTMQTVRDNTQATERLSQKIDGLSKISDGRIGELEKRVTQLEMKSSSA